MKRADLLISFDVYVSFVCKKRSSVVQFKKQKR